MLGRLKHPQTGPSISVLVRWVFILASPPPPFPRHAPYIHPHPFPSFSLSLSLVFSPLFSPSSIDFNYSSACCPPTRRVASFWSPPFFVARWNSKAGTTEGDGGISVSTDLPSWLRAGSLYPRNEVAISIYHLSPEKFEKRKKEKRKDVGVIFPLSGGCDIFIDAWPNNIIAVPSGGTNSLTVWPASVYTRDQWSGRRSPRKERSHDIRDIVSRISLCTRALKLRRELRSHRNKPFDRP